MPVFPKKTPDEIIFGLFFIISGIFFFRYFEMSPILNILPKISLIAGILYLLYGIYSIKKQGGTK